MKRPQPAVQETPHLSLEDRRGLYRTILGRRDVRGEFLPDPIPDAVLSRILVAAHHAPSVGFMQPWNFLVITDPAVKNRVHEAFQTAHAEAAKLFAGERGDLYRSLKLEGIREAPVNICVTCDRDRAGPVVIGRTNDRRMDLYSSACCVQNLWLAARSEGVGVGWVSIVHPEALHAALGIPPAIVPIAYLCLGWVARFFARPELESAGWLPRLPLDELISFNHWDRKADPSGHALLEQVREDMEAVKSGAFVPRRLDANDET
ncbi:MAG: 5,6-dimethylbenzimidazole synthase [Magnetococcales bacterium]|nr:5,6-dimethylbenzimidazole synthase [Magnetococcales bacterium]